MSKEKTVNELAEKVEAKSKISAKMFLGEAKWKLLCEKRHRLRHGLLTEPEYRVMRQINNELLKMLEGLSEKDKKRYRKVLKKVQSIMELQRQSRMKVRDLCFSLGIPLNQNGNINQKALDILEEPDGEME